MNEEERQARKEADHKVLTAEVEHELSTTPWERIQFHRVEAAKDASVVLGIPKTGYQLNPLRGATFWKAFGLCWLAFAVFLLSLSVYRISTANTDATNTTRTETLCRSNFQSDLEIANASLIANFSDFASALDRGLKFDDPLRVKIRDERERLTALQGKAITARENSVRVCAERSGRSAPAIGDDG